MAKEIRVREGAGQVAYREFVDRVANRCEPLYASKENRERPVLGAMIKVLTETVTVELVNGSMSWDSQTGEIVYTESETA